MKDGTSMTIAARPASKFLQAALIACAVSGCAAQETARHAAALSAESVNGLKREMQAFVGQANDLRVANETRLQLLERQTLALRVDAGQESSAWQVSKDQRALEMYTAMTAVSADSLTKTSLALDLLRPQPTPPKINFSSGEFDTLVQHLNELAAEASLSESLSALIEFGTEVSEQLQTDVKNAEMGLAEAPKAADSKIKLLLPNSQ